MFHLNLFCVKIVNCKEISCLQFEYGFCKFMDNGHEIINELAHIEVTKNNVLNIQ